MTDWHSYEPKNGHGLPFDPVNAIVAPRPIGWISTRSVNGVRNLAPYSYFNLINQRPPLIAFSSSGRKHTLTNIEASREFVWNLVTRQLAEAMNMTSARLPADVDEFAIAGLAAVPSLLVRPDRVALSPASFECRLIEIVRLTTQDMQPLDQWLVIGEAVAVHIDKAKLANGVYKTAEPCPIGRAGGTGEYFETTVQTLFTMPAPV